MQLELKENMNVISSRSFEEMMKMSLFLKVLCRCGAMDKELECTSLTSRADDALCEKKCSKKRNCGKHKCGAKCCIDPNHICTIVCGKTLSCGLHRYDDVR